MNNNFFGLDDGQKIGTGREEFNFSDAEAFSINLKDSMALQAGKIAEQEGKIGGLMTIVSSLQSYKGFLQGVLLSIIAVMLVGFGLLINSQARSDDKIDALSGKATSLEGKISSLEREVDALPARISTELRETSRDLVLISQRASDPPQTERDSRLP